MEQNLKQRLVGALVLISLAVIFLPLVFDGQQQRIDTTQYSIPEQPALTLKAVDIEPLEQQAAQELAVVNAITQQKQEQEEAAAAQMPADNEPSSVSAAAGQPAPVIPAASPETTPASKSPVATYIEQEKKIDQALQTAPPGQTVDLAEAWIIQVGAFSSQPNADGLRDKLKANGYPAFVKPVKVASGNLFKVYVGPEIRHHRVDQQKLELEQKYQLKALILKYIP